MIEDNAVSATVGYARAAAADWVQRHVSKSEGYIGAYFSGSTVGLPDTAVLPVASDIDIVVVLSLAEPPLKPGKFVYRGVLVEVTYLSVNLLASSDEVLASYHLAGSFRVDTIVDDPSGFLRKLQNGVSQCFTQRAWVQRRCENVRSKIEKGLQSIDTSAPMHDQVMSWLFSTGIMTHVLLVAALRNPTVRRRYEAAREVMAEYGHTAVYEELLKLLGCADWTSQRAEHHLAGLARTFDAAASVAKTPYFFSSDITTAARPIAIDGSRELIKNGLHREAVFWIVATFARCHKIMAADAPELQRELLPAFQAVVADLGITSSDDIIRRAGDALRYMPRLWQTAEAIIAANPDIIDPPNAYK